MGVTKRIASARKSKRLSQAQLLTIIGLSKSACGLWEAGYSSPSTAHLVRLAELLEVSFEWLATGREGTGMSAIAERSGAYITEKAPTLPGELQSFNAWPTQLPERRRQPVLKILRQLQEMHVAYSAEVEEVAKHGEL